MKLFEYYRPENAQAAINYFQKNEGAQYVAGATNLLDLMKKNVVTPTALIDISRLPLREIRPTNKGIYVGALALNSDVAAHPDVVRDYPLLSKALLAGASPQLRNMATIGGNILQRTRCPYFYDTALPCNKRQPGSGCGAKEGFNRMSAIFGASDQCVAVHPSDLCIALAALDAEVLVQSTNGTRTIPFKDFHRLPADTPERDNTLEKGELITEIFIPKNPFAQHSEYLKIRDRASYAFALVSVAIALYVDGNGRIADARVCVGGVAHKPWRLYDAESRLRNAQAIWDGKFEKLIETIAESAILDAKTLENNGFKIKLLQNTLVTALETVLR